MSGMRCSIKTNLKQIRRQKNRQSLKSMNEKSVLFVIRKGSSSKHRDIMTRIDQKK